MEDHAPCVCVIRFLNLCSLDDRIFYAKDGIDFVCLCGNIEQFVVLETKHQAVE